MSQSNLAPSNSGSGSPSRAVKDAASDQMIFQFVGFRLGDRDYAFPIDQTREIVELQTITPTPEVPSHVAGVSNLRGQIIPIVDLQRLLIPDSPRTQSKQAVVVEVNGQLTGCLVDSVTRVVRIPQSNIQTADEVLDDHRMRSVDGFARNEDTIMILLDAARLLSRE